MIEELKLILETIGDLSGVAVWVIAGFLLFKLVVYMSTTGAVVFLTKMAIEALRSWLLKEPSPENLKDEIYGMCIGKSGEYAELRRTLRKAMRSTGSFLHGSDVRWLEDAIDAHIAREKTSGKSE